jgi:hypothetical protein
LDANKTTFRNFCASLRAVPVLVTVLSLFACTTVTYESYRPVQNRNVDIAYVADGADFSRYRRLQADEMGIFYPSHLSADEDDLQRVRGAFQQAFRARISDYDIVDEPAADVLLVRASLVDLRNTAADRLPNIADDLNAILEPGKLTFAIEMRDSVTGNLLLRAADTQKSPDMDMPDERVSDGVRDAAEHWADLLGNFLDQNLDSAGG